MQAAVIGLLLSMAALCGFGCWGVYHFMKGVAVLTAHGDAALKAATVTEQKAGTVADNLNSVVNTEKPLLAQVTKNLAAATANVKKATAGLNVAVTEINRPCGTGDSCGTIATLNRALNSVRLAAGQVTAISLKEQDQRKLMNDQETQIADATATDLTKLGTAIDGITALATNKDLTGSLAETNKALTSVSGMADETAKAWHDFLHPKLLKRIESAVTTWGSAVAKFFVP